ncbi:ankyrin repeat-containing domain protein [Trichoderma chlorosporum]
MANGINDEAGKAPTHGCKFLIYLVGFQDVADHTKKSPMLDKIISLVPEAQILHHNIYRKGPISNVQKENAVPNETPASCACQMEASLGNENAMISKSKMEDMMELYDLISPSWIEKEALNLLTSIRHVSIHKGAESCYPVLLAGYGFGGVIVKHAMVIANSSPRFYDIAIKIDSLVFVYTPGPLRKRTKWENNLIEMLNITQKDYQGRLSQILQSLVEFVFQLGYAFHRFSGKYHITHWIGTPDEDESCSNQYPYYLEKVVTWPYRDAEDILRCEVEDLDALELIRDSFAPHHLLYDQLNAVFSSEKIGNTYFNALHYFSPSKWIIYDPATLDEYTDYNGLKRVYLPLCQEVPAENLHGISIQVIGPQGHGKSAFIKFFCEKLMQESSVVVVQNFNVPFKRRLTLYDVYIYVIHQIISQRPSLYLAVQTLMSDTLHQDQWTEEVLECLLSSILHHSRGIHFLVVIYDFQEWPADVRNWWLRFSHLLEDSFGSTFTFLISCNEPIQNLTETVVKIDMKEQSDLVERFISAKVRRFFDQGHSLISDRDILRQNIEGQCLLSAKTLGCSFSMRTSYLTGVFQRLNFHSLAAIKESISNVGVTEMDTCRDHLLALDAKPPIIASWAMSILSWILQSVRPMHPEELAAAAAMNQNRSILSEIQDAMSMDIERDLHNHLGGLVVVEQKCARIINPQMVQDFLSNADTKGIQQLRLQTGERLIQLTLKYLTIAIESESGKILNNLVSQIWGSDRLQADLDPVLGFVDYACRFWVTHFHRIKESSEDLKAEVIEFLQNSKISNRWFELYLLCHGLKACPSGEESIKTVPIAETKGFETINTQTTYSALQLATHFGLLSLLPHLISESQDSENPKVFHVRRGYSEHDTAVLNSSKLTSYLSDSRNVGDKQHSVHGGVETQTPPLYKWSSCHQAARLGDLKAFQRLLQSPADLSDGNQEGHTVLHSAAICGSIGVISLIINMVQDKPELVLNFRDRLSQTPLVLSTRVGNFKSSRLLAESGTDISIEDSTGKTAMHHAVLHCPQLLKFLAKNHKGLLFLPDNEGRTILHLAAQYGSVESVRTIVDAFALEQEDLSEILNKSDVSNFTPLHYAAKNGHEEIIQILMEKSQKATLLNNLVSVEKLAAEHGHLRTLRILDRGQLQLEDQLLMAAVEAGQLLVVQYLLQAGITPDQEIGGQIPICVAAAHGWDAILRILLRHGANINSQDANRQTPLHHASQNGIFDVVKTLLDSGLKERANVDDMDSSRHTPLHLAAKSGHERVINLLLASKADIEAQSRLNQTPLHLAVKYPKAVQALSEQGASLKTLDILGQTPLHKAVIDKHYESVEVLLEKGADIHTADREENSPLQNAMLNDDVPMVQLFMDQFERDSSPEAHLDDWFYCTLAIQTSAQQVLQWLLDQFPELLTMGDEERSTLLHLAVELDSCDIVHTLIRRGSNLNQISDKGSPLHVAVDMDQLDNLRLLIEEGGSALLIDQTDLDNNTPLHMAGKKGNIEAITLLISAGADINKAGERDETPLFMAAYAGHADAVQKFLELDADPNIPREDGWSPLHAAADNIEITHILLKWNANVNQQKDDLWTPLHLAVLWETEEVVKTLLQHGADQHITNSEGKTPFDLTIDNKNQGIKVAFLQVQGGIDGDV